MATRITDARLYLLSVGRRGLAELVRLPHDLVILGILSLIASPLTETGRVGGSTKVLQTGLFGVGVETLLLVAVAGSRGGNCERQC